ncbi:MAG: hypothetical protein U5J99_10995 [Parvularculaceae bacterium]|nr:hypothetical protein [Parvularculaceae bacterium]
MTDPHEDAEDAAPLSRRDGAVEKPRPEPKSNPAREERLAKALRENLKRRKANTKDRL